MNKSIIQQHAEKIDDVEAILRKHHLNASYDFHQMAQQIVGCVLAKKNNHEKNYHPFTDRRRRHKLPNG